MWHSDSLGLLLEKRLRNRMRLRYRLINEISKFISCGKAETGELRLYRS